VRLITRYRLASRGCFLGARALSAIANAVAPRPNPFLATMFTQSNISDRHSQALLQVLGSTALYVSGDARYTLQLLIRRPHGSDQTACGFLRGEIAKRWGPWRPTSCKECCNCMIVPLCVTLV
jgi:hypothetical protein